MLVATPVTEVAASAPASAARGRASRRARARAVRAPARSAGAARSSCQRDARRRPDLPGVLARCRRAERPAGPSPADSLSRGKRRPAQRGRRCRGLVRPQVPARRRRAASGGPGASRDDHGATDNRADQVAELLKGHRGGSVRPLASVARTAARRAGGCGRELRLEPRRCACAPLDRAGSPTSASRRGRCRPPRAGSRLSPTTLARPGNAGHARARRSRRAPTRSPRSAPRSAREVEYAGPNSQHCCVAKSDESGCAEIPSRPTRMLAILSQPGTTSRSGNPGSVGSATPLMRPGHRHFLVRGAEAATAPHARGRPDQLARGSRSKSRYVRVAPLPGRPLPKTRGQHVVGSIRSVAVWLQTTKRAFAIVVAGVADRVPRSSASSSQLRRQS